MKYFKIFSFLFLFFSFNILSAQGDIPYVLANSQRYRSFVSLLKASKYDELLRMKGPYTVLVPSDDALLKLDNGKLVRMTERKNMSDKLELYDFVKQYIIEGSYTYDQLKAKKEVKNIAGKVIKIEANFKELKLNGCDVLQRDMKAKNGYAHEISNFFPEQ